MRSWSEVALPARIVWVCLGIWLNPRKMSQQIHDLAHSCRVTEWLSAWCYLWFGVKGCGGEGWVEGLGLGGFRGGGGGGAEWLVQPLCRLSGCLESSCRTAHPLANPTFRWLNRNWLVKAFSMAAHPPINKHSSGIHGFPIFFHDLPTFMLEYLWLMAMSNGRPSSWNGPYSMAMLQ